MHGTLLLAFAWLLNTTLKLRLAWRELLRRSALFGGVLTASIAFLPTPPLTMLPSAVPGTNSVRAMFSVPAATSSDIEYKAKTAADVRQVATIEQSLRSAANIDSALIDDAPARAFRHGRFHAY